MALGMVRAGCRTSSPSVAMRAYPAKAKNSSPAACKTPPTVIAPDGTTRERSARPLARQATTATASTTRTTATIARVSQAALCTPT